MKNAWVNTALLAARYRNTLLIMLQNWLTKYNFVNILSFGFLILCINKTGVTKANCNGK